MWGRLSSLSVRRTFQSGLGATRKQPQLADKNVCPTQAALQCCWPTSEFRMIASPSLARPCILLADDLTGACDAGVQFTLHGFSSRVVLLGDATTQGEVGIASTDSRDLAPQEAEARVREACQRMGILCCPGLPAAEELLFKKIDTVFRGNIGCEVKAMMTATGRRLAVVAPAFPAMGRTIPGGWLETASAGSAGQRLYVPELLRQQGLESVRCLTRAETGCIGGLKEAIANGAAGHRCCLVVDAETQEDLTDLVRAAGDRAAEVLWVGSAGLAGALATFLADGRWVPEARERPLANYSLRRGPVLTVVGSTHPVTQAQCKAAENTAGAVRVHLAPSLLGKALAALKAEQHLLACVDMTAVNTACLEEFLQAAVHSGVCGLVLTGGDTASLVCRTLGAKAIRLGGEVRTGVPWGRLQGGLADGCRVVTKSGGFGEADALSAAAAFLAESL